MKVFSPPFDEFEVASVSVPAGASLALPANPGPQLLLVQDGGGSAAASLPAGAASLLGAQRSYTVIVGVSQQPF